MLFLFSARWLNRRIPEINYKLRIKRELFLLSYRNYLEESIMKTDIIPDLVITVPEFLLLELTFTLEKTKIGFSNYKDRLYNIIFL